MRQNNRHEHATENVLVKKLYIYISFPLDFNGPYLVNPKQVQIQLSLANIPLQKSEYPLALQLFSQSSNRKIN